MIPYVLHVALLISVCLLFYKLLLQRETFYRLNRIILVFCLGLSFILPIIPVPQQFALRALPPVAESTVYSGNKNQLTFGQTKNDEIKAQVIGDAIQRAKISQSPKIGQPVVAEPKAVPAEVQTPILQRIISWLFYLYWIGVGAFALNLLLQIVVLLFQTYTKPFIQDGKFRIVELTGDKAPCSFGNNIFINPEKYDWETYSQILLHEKVHIEQRHSVDIIMAELVLVLQWFNPFAWLYRTEVENNLEFLTDDAVLGHKEVEKATYQLSLLKVSAPHLSLGITTNYNQSLLKRRILMMNAKKSNIHIMWKYFFLLPLLGVMACALNDPSAFGQATKKVVKSINLIKRSNHTGTEGSWFANIKNDKIRIEFRSDSDDNNWSSNSDFNVSELSALPKEKKGEFTLKRDAGYVLFTGKFDGNQGYGHYKFTADNEFTTFLHQHGITGLDEGDQFALFSINIKKDYVLMLENNGYKNISKNDLIAMGALKVDEPYIHFWKEKGYSDLNANQLVSGKALGITSEYVNEIQKAGYKHLSFEQLESFKATGVTAKFIAGLPKPNLNSDKTESAEPDKITAEEVVSVKALNVESTYIDGLQKEGYNNISINDLTNMKAVGVTPKYIEELKMAGYKNIPAHELVSLKSLGVTTAYVKSFADIGYKNIPERDLSSMKSVGVTPEFAAGLKSYGYQNISANDLVSMKSVGATPEFAKGFENLGYKNIPAHQLVSMKAVGVTPEMAESFRAAGYSDISPNNLVSLKSLGVTVDFAKSYADLGYNNIPIHELTSLKALGITTGYIKSFKDAGYQDVSINTFSGLKALGVTAGFIEGFKKIGFNDITLREATSLKANGITPEYILEMREKGFKSNDLNKYIQVKNAFN